MATESGDLVLRLGRLAYRNPNWTPARAHNSDIRNPADLAPTPGDITSVVAAVHTAADAITRIAAGDREAVRAAAAGHRLYVPAFTRTNAAVIRQRYRPAPRSQIDEILASYDDDRDGHPRHQQTRRPRPCARYPDLAAGSTARATTARPARLPAPRDARPA